MDKIQYINRSVKNRRGFALMITLSVLSVIIALTMVLLSYFEKVQEDADNTKALIQADVFYADIISIFQGFKDNKTLFPILYTTALPLRTPDNNFFLVLHCEPLNKGVNINWLGLKNNSKNEPLRSVALELFEMLAHEYNIEDTGKLYEMLLAEIGGENKFVLKEQSRLHQKNGIILYKQFREIISRYQFEVDDPKVGNIPWEKYFSFSPKAEKIDAAYSSAELISYLFDMDLSTVKEWEYAIDKGSLEVFVSENGGDYTERKSIMAGKTFLDASVCSVSYTLSEAQYKFRFEYIQGEAKHFEFYGKQ